MTTVDPRPSSNHADKLAARVVTQGVPIVGYGQ
jgi:hypothetical protein